MEPAASPRPHCCPSPSGVGVWAGVLQILGSAKGKEGKRLCHPPG